MLRAERLPISALTVFVICGSLIAHVDSWADPAPDDIAEIIGEAAKICRDKGGKPDSAAILRSEDWNGDGNADWIADFARLKCDGADNPACNPHGCMLQLYLRSGEGWDLVFEDFAKSYKFSTSGTDRIMHVTTSGIPCNKPATDTCSYNYRLDADGVSPVR